MFRIATEHHRRRIGGGRAVREQNEREQVAGREVGHRRRTRWHGIGFRVCVSEPGSRVQGRTMSPHRNTGGVVRILAALLALASCSGSNGTSEPPPTTPAASYRVLF